MNPVNQITRPPVVQISKLWSVFRSAGHQAVIHKDLDLVIEAPDEFDVTARQPAGLIARAFVAGQVVEVGGGQEHAQGVGNGQAACGFRVV